MAGGTFDSKVGKVRPGTYINFESSRQDLVGGGLTGKALIPLINHDYGPEKEFITITKSALGVTVEKLGYSVYDDNPGMLLIREALKNASEVMVYIPKQGAKATATGGGLIATAKYGGEGGNRLKYTVIANPKDGFDVAIYMGVDTVFNVEGILNREFLVAYGNPYIEFGGTGDLEETPGTSLEGGVTGNATNGDLTTFLDDSESVAWDVMAFPLAPSGQPGDTVPALQQAILTKIKYLREDVGKYRMAVITGLEADYEGIINVTNSVELSGGVKLSTAQITAWVAGASAGAGYTKSNTYAKYVGAVGIIGQKNHQESVAAINRGEFFFSYSEKGEVIVEYDINSLVTFIKPKDKTYRKNRVIRTLDAIGTRLQLEFPSNKFDNSPDHWAVMQGLGYALLRQFEEAGGIKNVNDGTDFIIDSERSHGDETFFNVMVQPVDSAEKLFFTLKTS